MRNSFHHKHLELENYSKTNFSWVQSALQERRSKPQCDAPETVPGTGACGSTLDPGKATTHMWGAHSSFAAPARSALQTHLHQLQINEALQLRPCQWQTAVGKGAWAAWKTCHFPRPPSHTPFPRARVRRGRGGSSPAALRPAVAAARP